jgi:hypothetical protein
MQRPAANAVVGKAAITIPAFKIESTVSLVALPLECAEVAVELIPKPLPSKLAGRR